MHARHCSNLKGTCTHFSTTSPGSAAFCNGDASAAAASLPMPDSLSMAPLVTGRNATSPRTEVPLSVFTPGHAARRYRSYEDTDLGADTGAGHRGVFAFPRVDPATGSLRDVNYYVRPPVIARSLTL